MAKYRKKAVIVDAVPYEPGMEDGFAAYALTINPMVGALEKDSFIGYFDKGGPLPKCNLIPAIKTLEGFHEVSPGDWIITGIAGERYPCKPDIFMKTYEGVDE